MKKKKLKNKKEGGFSIFIAIIVTGVMLAISFSVSNLASKQTSFATTNRDSQYASFAADAGVECALYWDTKFNSFATSSGPATIYCNSSTAISGSSIITGTTTLNTRIGGGGNSNPMSAFGCSLNSPTNVTNACAIVTVNKYYIGQDLVTHIFSRGYNNCNTSDPRRVERGIEVQY